MGRKNIWRNNCQQFSKVYNNKPKIQEPRDTKQDKFKTHTHVYITKAREKGRTSWKKRKMIHYQWRNKNDINYITLIRIHACEDNGVIFKSAKKKKFTFHKYTSQMHLK